MCESWMYWTDWEEDEVNDSIGRIEKAWMDGSNRRIFVTSNMLWPNGLTLDHSTSTMYWCDAYYDHIERIYLNGTGRMVSFKMLRLMVHSGMMIQKPVCRTHLSCDFGRLVVNLLLRFKGPKSGMKENDSIIAIFFLFFLFLSISFTLFCFCISQMVCY